MTTNPLDHCPRCGRKILDFDENGMELPDGQRWCLDHYQAVLDRMREFLKRLS